METNKNKKVQYLPCLLILLQSLLYGFGDPISKDAYEIMPVYALLAIRYFIALAALMAFAGKRILHGVKESRPRDWLLPGLCIGAAYICGNVALEKTAATSVAFLRSLSTVMTPLLAFMIYKRRLKVGHIVILLFVILGLYLLCGHGGLSTFGTGEVFALLAALLLASSLIFGERALDKLEPLTLTAIQTAFSFVMAFICALLWNGGLHFSVITPKIWGIIVYLAILCTLAGYLLQNKALMKISARTVSLLQCSCPVMTALFSRIILGEKLSALGVLGVVILLACIAAETLPEKQ